MPQDFTYFDQEQYATCLEALVQFHDVDPERAIEAERWLTEQLGWGGLLCSNGDGRYPVPAGEALCDEDGEIRTVEKWNWNEPQVFRRRANITPYRRGALEVFDDNTKLDIREVCWVRGEDREVLAWERTWLAGDRFYRMLTLATSCQKGDPK